MNARGRINAAPSEPVHDVRVRKMASGQYVVFGLDWSPLVGGAPQRLGLQRARALGATHYVLSGKHATVVGAVRLEPATAKLKGSLHSAAAVFSSRHPVGAIAYVLPDPSGSCWMIACHAGSVLSQTDRWFESQACALAVLDRLRSRFPGLQVQIEQTLDQHGLPVWLGTTLCEQSRLQRIQALGYLARTPLRICVAVSLAASLAYGLLPTRNTDLQQERQDTQAVWRASLLELSRQHTVHAFSHLSVLTQTWQKIPLLPSGWILRKIQCESQGFDWQCVAQYARQYRWALNQHLEQVMPVGWSMQFTPLDEAAFLWRVPQAATTLDLSEHWMAYDWMSYLQSIGSAFEHIQVGAATKFVIPAPDDGQGQALALAPGIPQWKQRTLVIKGPLRALVALDRLHMPVRWRRASLDIDRAQGLGTPRSALSLELVGDMFESRSE